MDESKTMKNLEEGFAGESMANRKYLAFAQQAEAEGYHRVAVLFRATAEAETIHALAHFKAMGKLKDTPANLQAAIDGETYEFTKMYPDFLVDAEAENNAAAIRSFKLAKAAEEVHAELYEKALKNLAGEKAKAARFFLCPVCGHIAEDEAPEACPICGAKKSAYKLYE